MGIRNIRVNGNVVHMRKKLRRGFTFYCLYFVLLYRNGAMKISSLFSI